MLLIYIFGFVVFLLGFMIMETKSINGTADLGTGILVGFIWPLILIKFIYKKMKN